MIELKHLSKTFETAGGRVDALKDVSLTIPDGDVYGIIGMSGAGKSTLVRCINMLERPTSGEVIVNGKRLDTMSPAQLRAARHDITMIFQRFNLLMQRTCLRNVCFPMELSGMKKADAEKRARELLELPERPDGIICTNSLMTVGTMWAIQEKGLRMPEDLSLIAFDDYPYTPLLSPKPTVIEIDLFSLGVHAAAQLLRKIRDPAMLIQTYTALPRLIQRETTADK